VGALASLFCGFMFGWGLLISGMIRPDKVLGFLDVLAIRSGNWDPSLAVVMAAALAVIAPGYALARRRSPLFAAQNQWPKQTAIDRPLLAGATVFGIGWGLVGLCPGPAIENLATGSPSVVVFVAAMAIGMFAYRLWGTRAASGPAARVAIVLPPDG
jgi:uncharacterized protein